MVGCLLAALKNLESYRLLDNHAPGRVAEAAFNIHSKVAHRRAEFWPDAQNNAPKLLGIPSAEESTSSVMVVSRPLNSTKYGQAFATIGPMWVSTTSLAIRRGSTWHRVGQAATRKVSMALTQG